MKNFFIFFLLITTSSMQLFAHPDYYEGYFIAIPSASILRINYVDETGMMGVHPTESKRFQNPDGIGSPTIPFDFCVTGRALGVAHFKEQGTLEDVLIVNYQDNTTKKNYLLFATFDALADRWKVVKAVHLNFFTIPYTWAAHHVEAYTGHPNWHRCAFLISEISSFNGQQYNPTYNGMLVNISVDEILTDPSTGIINITDYSTSANFGFSPDFNGLCTTHGGGVYYLYDAKTIHTSTGSADLRGLIVKLDSGDFSGTSYPSFWSISWDIFLNNDLPYPSSGSYNSYLAHNLMYVTSNHGMIKNNYWEHINLGTPYSQINVIQSPPWSGSHVFDVAGAVVIDAANKWNY